MSEEEPETTQCGRITPNVILLCAMLINIVNCSDRFSVGVLLDQIKVDVHAADESSQGSCLSPIQGFNRTCVHPSNPQCENAVCEYNHPHCLSTPQLGFISSTFLFGLMIASPLCASMVHYIRSSVLLFISLLVWSIAVITTGATTSYSVLLITRAFSGAAEGAFYTIVYPYINSIAPHDRRGLWIAYLAASTPIGAATGFGLAGILSSTSWRTVFYLNGTLMVPLALLCLLLPPLKTIESSKAGELESSSYCSHTVSQFMACVGSTTFMALVLGYSMRVFVSGAWSYWGFDFVMHTGLSCDKPTVSLLIGVVTASAGLVGTLSGGACLDLYRDKRQGAHERLGLVMACQIVCISAVVCVPFMFLVPAIESFILMITTLAVALYFLFFSDAVICNAVMWSVPVEAQTMAMAVMNAVSHALGDVPAGPVVGWFQSSAASGQDTPESWRIAFYLCAGWSILSVCFYAVAYVTASQESNDAVKLNNDVCDTGEISPLVACTKDEEDS